MPYDIQHGCHIDDRLGSSASSVWFFSLQDRPLYTDRFGCRIGTEDIWTLQEGVVSGDQVHGLPSDVRQPVFARI